MSARKDNSPLFSEAPHQLLAFPQREPITAAEILAFLPNYLRTHDVTFRMASNGATYKELGTIANYHRHASAKGDISHNSICKIMQKAMRDTGTYSYSTIKTEGGNSVHVTEEWTNGQHQRSNTKDYYGPWDQTNLEIKELIPNVDQEDLIDNVDFVSLAVGVQRYPSVALGDGLNLSRCVEFAVANPHFDLKFPRDFTLLTNLLGRKDPQKSNQDAQIFRRFHRRTPQPPAPVIPRSPVAIPNQRVPLTATNMPPCRLAPAPQQAEATDETMSAFVVQNWHLFRPDQGAHRAGFIPGSMLAPNTPRGTVTRVPSDAPRTNGPTFAIPDTRRPSRPVSATQSSQRRNAAHGIHKPRAARGYLGKTSHAARQVKTWDQTYLHRVAELPAQEAPENQQTRALDSSALSDDQAAWEPLSAEQVAQIFHDLEDPAWKAYTDTVNEFSPDFHPPSHGFRSGGDAP
ncbi:hypothetical protein ACEQ8H_007233 [Pleosporales sp. CAS-2024a]